MRITFTSSRVKKKKTAGVSQILFYEQKKELQVFVNWLFWHFLQLKQKDGKEEEEEKFWPRLPQGALKVGE